MKDDKRERIDTADQAKQEYMIRVKLFILKSIHYLIIVALFYVTFIHFRYREYPLVKDVGFRYNYLVTMGFGALLLFFNRTYNSYLYGYSRIRTLALSQWLSQLFSIGIIYMAVSLGWDKFKTPWYFIQLLLGYAIIDCIEAYIGNWYYFKIHPARKTLLIYRNNRDRHRFDSMKGKPSERLYQVEKEIQFDGTFDEIKNELEGYEAVFVAGLNSRCRNGILKYCQENDIRGLFLPHVGDVIMQGAEHIQAYDSPVLMVRRRILKPEYRFVKRAFDITASLAGLILLSPVFLITALAIKLYDHGPVFYKQIRLTKDEKQFHVTMSQSMRKRLVFAQNGNKIDQIGTKISFRQPKFLPDLFSDRWISNLESPSIPDNVESGNEFS